MTESLNRHTRQFYKLLNGFLLWRQRHISDKTFTYILAGAVGFLSGLCAVVIKNSVHAVEWLATQTIATDASNLLYVALPFIGIGITVFIIKFLIKEDIAHGIPNTLLAISKRKGRISPKKMYASIITSAFTVGFGGSSGLEGPTVGTTSAVSSNFGRLLKVNHKTRILLIGCAASGALAAIFKAPIAAVVFALEVIMLDLTMSSLIPLLIASASAAITSRLIFGNDILFHFKLPDAFQFGDLPFYVALGIFAGLFSLYFTKVFTLITHFFENIKSVYIRWIVGGACLGLLIFIFPPLYGEGYGTINLLIEGNAAATVNNSIFYAYRENALVVTLFLFSVLMFKVVATTVTFGAGGVGGIFAPTLFMGSVLGFVFASGLQFLGFEAISMANFTLVAMAATMAGNLQAPLTAIFLIAEITGGYELFLPLMVSSSISFITVKYFVSHSVYTQQLAKRGELLTHNKDQSVLTLMQLQKVIETDFIAVKPYDKMRKLVEAIAASQRNLFPVLDKDNLFLGIVLLNDIREVMFDQVLYDHVEIHELMTAAPEHIYINDTMETVMNKFEQSGAWNLPVVDEGKYIGFVSKSKLFAAYRDALKSHYSSED